MSGGPIPDEDGPASRSHDRTRRAVVTSLAGLSLAASGQPSIGRPGQGVPARGARTLVTYFSRSGNTRVVAGLLQRANDADLFEIVPATPYPAEYLATVEQARQERDNGVEPALAAGLPGIARYETIFLGFPIWGETAPPVIRSFLSSHGLDGKKLVPFITHGGYGLGNSHAVIARHAPRAMLQRGFSMQADQERQTMEQVTAWLRSAPALR